jgi:F0F1-type ATP synthase epsilon subunit
MKRQLKVQILSQEKELWSGVAHSISIPALDGRATVLPGHLAAFYPLGKGMVRVDKHDKLEIGSGFASIDSDEVCVMVGTEIDSAL